MRVYPHRRDRRYEFIELPPVCYRNFFGPLFVFTYETRLRFPTDSCRYLEPVFRRTCIWSFGPRNGTPSERLPGHIRIKTGHEKITHSRRHIGRVGCCRVVRDRRRGRRRTAVFHRSRGTRSHSEYRCRDGQRPGRGQRPGGFPGDRSNPVALRRFQFRCDPGSTACQTGSPQSGNPARERPGQPGFGPCPHPDRRSRPDELASQRCQRGGQSGFSQGRSGEGGDRPWTRE